MWRSYNPSGYRFPLTFGVSIIRVLAMPLIASSSYRPPVYLRGGHLQTIIPSLFRKVSVSYGRERIDTPDDDFLDLDWALCTDSSLKLVILSHGLEGDSSRPYLAGMVRHLNQTGFDCLAWNYRSCSGEMNRQARMYHVGETGDLHHVIQYAVQKGYTTIYLLGFSMGGNITLKYLGEHGRAGTLHPALRRAVTFSVPLDVTTAATRLEAWDSMVYNRRFQRSLKAKVRQKVTTLPPELVSSDWQRVRTIRQFDNLITGPLHGYPTAEAYYTANSSLPFVPDIPIPTLIVNAKNDPFLSPECFPETMARELTNVWMEFPASGGHCGFMDGQGGLNGTYWSEKRAVQFLKKFNSHEYGCTTD